MWFIPEILKQYKLIYKKKNQPNLNIFCCVLSLSVEDIIFWFVAAVNSKRYDRRFARDISFDRYGHIFFLSLCMYIFWMKDKWSRRTNTDLFNRDTDVLTSRYGNNVVVWSLSSKKKKWPTSILCIGDAFGTMVLQSDSEPCKCIFLET